MKNIKKQSNKLHQLRKLPFALFYTLITCNISYAADYNSAPKVKPMSPEASLKTMHLQSGYTMEIAAAEPLIEEPVMFAFDGKGRMYVAEMLTYMQDIDANGQMKKISRIKRLEDKDKDGIFETATVFADNLLLPRMIATLGDGQILVRETNTLDLVLHTDIDNDGKADKKEVVFFGGSRGGNLEHQPSGLIYGLDNWWYVTYDDKRYKFIDGKVISEDIAYSGGQWGLGQDHIGRFYYSAAGGQNPVLNFQAPPIYGEISVKGEKANGFQEVFSLDKTPDVQGGLPMIKPDKTLKGFTGIAGQSIYLGGIFDDMQGDYIVPEPVGNLVRRATITREHGVSVISHPYQSQKKEFLASTDPNFRPTWSGTAPDGSLMILDMYRGIIQEGQWTKKGSYLRGVVEEYGFDKVIGRGRLYRVTKNGTKLFDVPNMFAKTPSQLTQYLGHKNQWWRLEAQKQIVLTQDKSIVPILEEMAVDNSQPLAQIHALWTLEGLGIINKKLLIRLLNNNTHETSQNSDIQVTAIRVSEHLVKQGDTDIIALWEKLASNKDIEISQQILLSAFYVSAPNKDIILANVEARHGLTKGITAIKKSTNDLIILNEKRKKLAQGNVQLAKAMIAGQKSFKALCSTCHGADGKGGDAGELLIAPSFHNNKRINGNSAQLISILLQGQRGTIDGVTYAGGMMPSVASNGHEYIANVLTYLRNEFGNQASMITKEDVTTVAKYNAKRTDMWTQNELETKFNQRLTDKTDWIFSNNFKLRKHKGFAFKTLQDKNRNTRFIAGEARMAGQQITIKLPNKASISEIIIDSKGLEEYYSRSYNVEFSLDGKKWNIAAKQSNGSIYDRVQTLGETTQYIRLTNLLGGTSKSWGIGEIDLIGRYLK